MWAMTHSYVCHDSSICLASNKTQRMKICDMTHSYVWHDSFTCMLCLIYKWQVPHSKWWLALLLTSNEIPFVHMCDMTHSYECHDSLMCLPQLCHMDHDFSRIHNWLCSLAPQKLTLDVTFAKEKEIQTVLMQYVVMCVCVCKCVCVCVCVCVCLRVYICMCVCVCVCEWVSVLVCVWIVRQV